MDPLGLYSGIQELEGGGYRFLAFSAFWLWELPGGEAERGYLKALLFRVAGFRASGFEL